MGFWAGIGAEKYDRQYTDKELIKRMVGYFKPQAVRLTQIAVLVLIFSGVNALQPILVSRGVDLLKGQPALYALGLVSLAVLVVSVTGWLVNWRRRVLTVMAIADTSVQLSSDAFDAATGHDLSFYDQYQSGKIVSRITTDTQDFGTLVNLITDVVSQFLETAILAVVLLSIEWRLALVLFAMIPIIFGLGISFRKVARKVTLAGMRAMANVNSTIKETISGIAVAKNFRQEGSIYRDFEEANRTSYKVNVRRGLTLVVVFPTLNAISGIVTAALVYTGGLTVEQGLVTAGAWYLFVLSLDRFLFPVMNLSSFWTQIQNGLSAAERVFALIDAEPAVTQTGSQAVDTLRGEIKFEHLNFFYKQGEPVLDDFSLDIRAGENIALVGHTGAGKSSVAKLIARFYEFQSGLLTVDGRDIRSLDLASYRRHLGIVSQTPFLFSDTVLENIRYANPSAGQDEIQRLAKQIGDGEWLETLPQGLETQVGERGARLSMGQRQLVSLMRVLVQHPAIFILDEATASIDPFTEWQIQQAINLILAQATSILIAHRLSTVKSADRIIVIENGHIIEQGNHAGLLSRGGQYANLYNTYFRHQSLAYVEQARSLRE